jgi:hypothetical protein
MNADLRKTGVYNDLQQKSVTAWMGLRNKAAHGEYGAYDERDVEALINGVRDFIVEVPFVPSADLFVSLEFPEQRRSGVYFLEADLGTELPQRTTGKLR